MAALTGKGLADFTKTKLGTPYVYGAKGAHGAFTKAKLDSLAKAYPGVFTSSYIAKAKKFIGSVCCDCSGLISWYTGKEIGSAQMYSTAKKRKVLNKSDVSKVPIGAVLWKQGHVGAYIGNGNVIEEKGIDYGCVKSKVINSAFTHYLLFGYIQYDKAVLGDSEGKESALAREGNPYREPLGNVGPGDENQGVKWVQFELREAGYFDVEINGTFDKVTLIRVKEFQQSCKIAADGVVGRITKEKLKG